MPSIHSDLSKRVVVLPDEAPWVSSPTAGVERTMLDRLGDEIERATSIVRYAPGSAFPQHVRGGGEEFFVLQGLFVDEDGQYPAGSWIRSPHLSGHAPFTTAEGAKILVKVGHLSLPAAEPPTRRPRAGTLRPAR